MSLELLVHNYLPQTAFQSLHIKMDNKTYKINSEWDAVVHSINHYIGTNMEVGWELKS